MTSEPHASRSPRTPLLAGDHFVTWLGLGALAIVGGVALLAHQTTTIMLIVAVGIMLTVSTMVMVAIFRLVGHQDDEPGTPA